MNWFELGWMVVALLVLLLLLALVVNHTVVKLKEVYRTSLYHAKEAAVRSYGVHMEPRRTGSMGATRRWSGRSPNVELTGPKAAVAAWNAAVEQCAATCDLMCEVMIEKRDHELELSAHQAAITNARQAQTAADLAIALRAMATPQHMKFGDPHFNAQIVRDQRLPEALDAVGQERGLV